MRGRLDMVVRSAVRGRCGSRVGAHWLEKGNSPWYSFNGPYNILRVSKTRP